MTAASKRASAAAPEDEVALDRIAEAFSFQRRSPIMRSPADQRLDYQDVSFPARDGTRLDGWYIPAAGSRRLVVVNHPMGFNRAGLPTHLEPWQSMWAASGNGFEVDFLPDYRILHDAGYNVLAYDLRNHGTSEAADGGVASSGIYEARDVAGSLDYVRGRPDTQHMSIALFSRCLGCSSTFAAAAQFPAVLDGVRCLVGAQPVTARTILGRRLAAMGLGDRVRDLEQRIVDLTGIGFADRAPQEWAQHVDVPTLLFQVREDLLTDPADVQTMFDNLPVADKALQWIPGTTSRWDGYLEFQRRPEPVLDWLAAHMR